MADTAPTVRLGDHDYPATFLLTAGVHLDEAVLALDAAGRLGYLAASQEWTDLAEPLPEPAQFAADLLCHNGALSINPQEVDRG